MLPLFFTLTLLLMIWIYYQKSRTDRSAIGFDAPVESKKQRDIGKLFAQVQPHDLLKFGIIPELVGRMPVITSLQSLTQEDLVKILVEPKNALSKQYQSLLAMDGVALEISDDAVSLIRKDDTVSVIERKANRHEKGVNKLSIRFEDNGIICHLNDREFSFDNPAGRHRGIAGFIVEHGDAMIKNLKIRA